MTISVATATSEPRRPAESEWLSRKEAARYLAAIGCPISVRMLEIRAANSNRGKGPPFTRIGWKTVRYSRVDLDEWAKRETVRVR